MVPRNTTMCLNVRNVVDCIYDTAQQHVGTPNKPAVCQPGQYGRLIRGKSARSFQAVSAVPQSRQRISTRVVSGYRLPPQTALREKGREGGGLLLAVRKKRSVYCATEWFGTLVHTW